MTLVLISTTSRNLSTHFLWTDATARLFMQTHYPSFLPTYDSYEYNIQRADAIRYFVLHRYGGIYMDLDVSLPASQRPTKRPADHLASPTSLVTQIGIIRDPTPLLLGDWDCVLAKTIPVRLLPAFIQMRSLLKSTDPSLCSCRLA